MKKVLTISALAIVLAAPIGCSKTKNGLEIETGSDVTLEKKDGVKVVGRLVEVSPAHVIVESRDGARTTVQRGEISAVRAVTPAPTPNAQSRGGDAAIGSTGSPARSNAADPGPRPESRPAYREVTIAAGTILPVELRTAVSSDSSRVEDSVRATLRRPVTVDGIQALPAGTAIVGHVTAAERSARVKGRAFVAFRFTALDPPGEPERIAIRTEPITRLAPATKKRDAAKIGGGAAGGAIIGGILGGGDGAAKGAAIGGAAGTGVVLSTRGKEVRLGPGTDVSVRLAAPLTLRVPER